MQRKLIHEDEWYTPSNLISLMKYADTDTPERKEAAIKAQKAIRKEYTRLRDISQKRLARMGNSMFKDSQTYKRYVNAFPKLKEIDSPARLAYKLAEIANFVESPTGSLWRQKTQMQKALETLHSTVDKDGVPKEAYNFVTAENFLAFGEFMEEYRNQKLDSAGYDSGEAADAFAIVAKHKISADQIKTDFEYWLENREVAKTLRRSEKRTGNPDELKKAVERKKKQLAKQEEEEE